MKIQCPYCEQENDAHFSVRERKRAEPKPGDFSVCAKCGKLARFTEDLKGRKLEEGEEQDVLPIMPQLFSFKALLDFVRKPERYYYVKFPNLKYYGICGEGYEGRWIGLSFVFIDGNPAPERLCSVASKEEILQLMADAQREALRLGADEVDEVEASGDFTGHPWIKMFAELPGTVKVH